MKQKLLTLPVLLSLPLSAATVVGSGNDPTATVIGEGLGSSPDSDFFGVVTSDSPLQIDGLTQVVSSSFSPVVGDVIGRDLASTGIGFTGDSVTWEGAVPTMPADYIANTFDAGTEEFRIFADSLNVDYSYETIPEPATALLGAIGLVALRRRRR